METSIRFIKVGGRAGVKPALCFRGRNQAHAVINDETCIRTISHVPLKQLDDAPIVMGPYGLGSKEYPIDLFVKNFQKYGERKGITLRAQYFLEHALEGGVKDDAPLPPDTLPGEWQQPTKTLPEKLPGDPRKPVSMPGTPKPGKPVAAPIRQPDGAPRTAGADIIARIAAELKLEPSKLRKRLRAAGLSAPYTDEKLIRSKLR